MLRRIACCLAVVTLAWSQSYQGEISGVVKDSTGGIVPGAKLELRHLDTGQHRTTVSDDQGRYHLLQLPTGPYKLEARHAGFRTFERSLTVEVGARDVLDVTLEVGDLGTSVQVEAEAPRLEAASGAIGAVADSARRRPSPPAAAAGFPARSCSTAPPSPAARSSTCR